MAERYPAHAVLMDDAQFYLVANCIWHVGLSGFVGQGYNLVEVKFLERKVGGDNCLAAVGSNECTRVGRKRRRGQAPVGKTGVLHGENAEICDLDWNRWHFQLQTHDDGGI